MTTKKLIYKTDIHIDFFVTFVKNYYFPFQYHYHKQICVMWLIAFILSIIYGPSFLNATRNSLDLPPSAPSYQAMSAFAKYYPQSSSYAPVIIVQQTFTQSTIINEFSKNFSTIAVSPTVTNGRWRQILLLLH